MSEILVNKLTGTSTAGSILVTGEGNSTTTNLQQGLAKVWASANTAGDALFDSFNVSSLTDTATGRQTYAIANDMANKGYSIVHGCGNDDNGSARHLITQNVTTAVYEVASYNTGATAVVDSTGTCSVVNGDLA